MEKQVLQHKLTFQQLTDDHSLQLARLSQSNEDALAQVNRDLSHQAESRIAELVAAHGRLVENLTEQSTAREKELSTEIQQLVGQVHLLSKSTETQKSQLERLTQSLAACEGERSRLIEQVETLQSKLVREEEQHGSYAREMEGRLNEVTVTAQSLQAQLANKEHSISLLIEQKVALEGQVNDLITKLRDAQSQTMEQTAALQLSLREIQQQYDRLEVQVRLKDQELEKAHADHCGLLEDSNRQASALSEVQAAADARAMELGNEVDNLRRSQERLSTQLATKMDELAVVRDEMVRANEGRDSCQASLPLSNT